MKLRENPLFHILHISKMIERSLDRDAQKGCGMSATDAKLLVIVGHHPGMAQSDLAAIVGVSAPAISRQINKLEQDGLLQRRPNPESRREFKIILTKEGQKIHTKTNSYLEKKLSQLLEQSGGVEDTVRNNLVSMAHALESHNSPFGKKHKHN